MVRLFRNRYPPLDPAQRFNFYRIMGTKIISLVQIVIIPNMFFSNIDSCNVFFFYHLKFDYMSVHNRNT